MKLIFEAPKRARMHRYFAGVSTSHPDENIQWFWYCENEKKWSQNTCDKEGHTSSNTAPCNTLRAFKRHIKKHSYLPKGTIFRLCNKYFANDPDFKSYDILCEI